MHFTDRGRIHLVLTWHRGWHSLHWLISHHPDEIEAFADRVLVLREGNFVEETTIEEIKKTQSVVRFISERIKSTVDESSKEENINKNSYKGRGDFNG